MLVTPAAFFSAIRQPLFPLGFKQSQVDGLNTILDACDSHPLAWVAYELATAYHEVGATMQPVREGFGKTDADSRRVVARRAYGKPGRNGGQVPYGRGLVQTTWDENYERTDEKLGLGGTLIANYDRLLEPAIAAAALARGMVEGWYTGKALATYLSPIYLGSRKAFGDARRIINGTDKADMIAGYALAFQSALVSGQWCARPQSV